MGKAPETCLYCKGTGEGPGSPCGFCENGAPLDTQEDWDNSWGKVFNFVENLKIGNWHNEVFEEMGWFDREECKASVSGKCLAVSHNLSYCYPECEENDTMDGSNRQEGGGV